MPESLLTHAVFRLNLVVLKSLQLQDTPLAENHVRKPCMRPVFSVPDDALTPLRELTRTIVNWIIDAVEETDNDKYLASTEAFLSLPCLLQDEEGVVLRNNPAKHALDSCLAKRADPNDVIQHVLNHRNEIFNARINRPSRPPKPTTTRNTLQRAKNLVDAKRPADALKSIETAGTLGILTSAQSLTESIREELFELHHLPTIEMHYLLIIHTIPPFSSQRNKLQKVLKISPE